MEACGQSAASVNADVAEPAAEMPADVADMAVEAGMASEMRVQGRVELIKSEVSGEVAATASAAGVTCSAAATDVSQAVETTKDAEVDDVAFPEANPGVGSETAVTAAAETLHSDADVAMAAEMLHSDAAMAAAEEVRHPDAGAAVAAVATGLHSDADGALVDPSSTVGEGTRAEAASPGSSFWLQLEFESPPVRKYHIFRQFREEEEKEEEAAGVAGAGRRGAEGVRGVEATDKKRKRSSGASSHSRTEACGNFLKGVKWSPDGACLLTASDDTRLRIFDLPDDVMQNVEREGDEGGAAEAGRGGAARGGGGVSLEAPLRDSLQAAVIVSEGETIYDFCWYPLMSSADPALCVLAASSKDHPIHLWDAITGQIRCTYRAYDHMDEITAALSLSFSHCGQKLLAGYRRTIRVFDVSRPGRECVEFKTVDGAKNGQKGIISCIAPSPTVDSFVAAGSYDGSVGIYADFGRQPITVLHGQRGGVTQVQFSRDGNYLYTGARKDSNLHCWDVRNFSGVVYSLDRVSASTNQRLQFDIEPCGRHLATGGEDGCVRAFDLSTGELAGKFQAASDIVNGFAFHPSLPLSATSSGQRRFRTPQLVSVASDDDEGSNASNHDDDHDDHGGQNLAGKDKAQLNGAKTAGSLTTHLDTLSSTENCVSVWQHKFSWQT